MTTIPPNNRASLLSGLRTGGVRSASSTIPYTASPGGAFNVPRIVSEGQRSLFPPERDAEQVGDVHSQAIFANKTYNNKSHPMTAAVDGPNNSFSQQQQHRGMNPNSVPFTPSFVSSNLVGQANVDQNPGAQAQALQMQMMQMEILRLQALQTQQMQAEIYAQAQVQQLQQTQVEKTRRVGLGPPPATAGPTSTSFDMRSISVNEQLRRARQEQTQTPSDDQVPMTAGIAGRFATRLPSVSAAQVSRFPPEENADSNVIPGTTVISGGTSLGSSASNNHTPPSSKSDSASSWRRADKNNSVLRTKPSASKLSTSSVSVKVTPPVESVVVAPSDASPSLKTRPRPLSFGITASQPLSAVAVDNNENDTDSSSSKSNGSGAASGSTTPETGSSNELPLTIREEASKKLYESLGLGLSRSVTSNTIASGGDQVECQVQQQPTAINVSHRMASQPTRQPIGPPSGDEDLGPKNFATRIRRKAIGGLGVLMGARERREVIEVF